MYLIGFDSSNSTLAHTNTGTHQVITNGLQPARIKTVNNDNTKTRATVTAIRILVA